MTQKEWDCLSYDEQRKEYKTMATMTPHPVIYHCSMHGEFDALRVWGCPECVAVARDLVAALRAIVKITDGSQPIDYPGALMVARTALAKVQS